MLAEVLGRMYIIVNVTAALGGPATPTSCVNLAIAGTTISPQDSLLSRSPSHLAFAYQHNYNFAHNRRPTDRVSKLWPRSSASALLTIAEVLEPRHTPHLLAKTIFLWHWDRLCFWNCILRLSGLIYCMQPLLTGGIHHLQSAAELSLLPLRGLRHPRPPVRASAHRFQAPTASCRLDLPIRI